jgi:hypothetical protein
MGSNGEASNRARSALSQPKVVFHGLDPRIHALVSGTLEGVDGPRNQSPPGLIPGRGAGLCPGAGSGLKVHGPSPAKTKPKIEWLALLAVFCSELTASRASYSAQSLARSRAGANRTASNLAVLSPLLAVPEPARSER